MKQIEVGDVGCIVERIDPEKGEFIIGNVLKIRDDCDTIYVMDFSGNVHSTVKHCFKNNIDEINSLIEVLKGRITFYENIQKKAEENGKCWERCIEKRTKTPDQYSDSKSDEFFELLVYANYQVQKFDRIYWDYDDKIIACAYRVEILEEALKYAKYDKASKEEAIQEIVKDMEGATYNCVTNSSTTKITITFNN